MIPREMIPVEEMTNDKRREGKCKQDVRAGALGRAGYFVLLVGFGPQVHEARSNEGGEVDCADTGRLETRALSRMGGLACLPTRHQGRLCLPDRDRRLLGEAAG